MNILTAIGEKCLSKGSIEAMIFEMVKTDGSSKSELQKKFGKEFKPGFGQLMRRKVVKFDKKTGLITRTGTDFSDEAQELCSKVNGLNDKEIKLLKKRKMVETKSITDYEIRAGKDFGKGAAEDITEIDAEVLEKNVDKDGNWTGRSIKPMNLKAVAALPPLGCLHPLMKVRQEFREILIGMGFEEMKTNNYVESSFWNFDALFQPQQHPARDAHDTFFLHKPATSKIDPTKKDYFERVRQTHENGGDTGSLGWRMKWSAKEAEKNLLRTHTTAISSQMLYKCAQNKPFKPVKYFSIDRVFRNETIDTTHLAEFHQVEGFVADVGLTLGHLIGVIAEFFKAIGIPDVKFKPAYNPYTEPSMEIFGWSPALKKWMEVGNSGVFRPEMLRPM
eukprot:UN24492